MLSYAVQADDCSQFRRENLMTLIIVPDCNVLIHGKSLYEIPWEEFDAEEIEIRLVSQVVTEVDSLKNRNGRPSRVARQISESIRNLLSSTDQCDIVRVAGPIVRRRLWLGKYEAKKPMREGIDLAHGDQAIINQILAMADSGSNVILLTDDTIAAARAVDYGINFKLLPPQWRRPDEQDETMKENERLKSENARLKAAEPNLKAWFESEDGEIITHFNIVLKRYLPLSKEVIEGFVARIQAAVPMARLERPASVQIRDTKNRFGIDLASLRASYEALESTLTDQQISKYESDYANWIQTIRNQFENIHVVRSRGQSWGVLSLLAENSGTRPAERAFVEIEVSGDFQIEYPYGKSAEVADREANYFRRGERLVLPPKLPKPERFDRILSATRNTLFDHDIVGNHRIIPSLQSFKSREVDAFYWREGRDGPVKRMDLECASWRHRREPERFVFSPTGAEDKPIKGVVIATMSASNVSSPLVVKLPVRISFEDCSLLEDAEKMVESFLKAVSSHTK